MELLSVTGSPDYHVSGITCSGTTVNWAYNQTDQDAHTPKIKLQFYYEYRRNGADMQYRIKTVVRPLTETSSGGYYGYDINQDIKLDNTTVETGHVLHSSSDSNRWSSAIEYTTGWYDVTKNTGTTTLSARIYATMQGSKYRDQTYTADLYVVPYNPHSKIYRTNDSGGSWSKTYKAYKTTNGGLTWEQIDLMKTTNSGSSWNKVD